MPQARILVFAGSTAPAAAASRLAAAFARELAFLDADVTLISLADYSLPLHDPDAPRPQVPIAAAKLRSLLKGHHAAFIATPEINGSVPALLKNVVDWLEEEELPFRPLSGRIFALGSVSADGSGGRLALAHLRAMLADGLAATIVGRGLAIGDADSSFDDKGRLDDPRQAAAMQALARELVFVARRLAAEP
ncbi:NAD(P)H-dependent oxidoreductase [Kaistia dalseonensis]|uniref:NAD(P)H-dependent FMN reductase n=1 Tax=Kaistia dalseonensis TaxID=410840 RepID=A0ABU0H584_9HYPH|nr:NAD(P)H-dependent oxidoreductase [Kaistia dalseonensis]MCX5494884.1 NAD(P)H-dependent oxidoreductase [Kaistia dalseonensis]MDQ0437465.1 NAD(P)H-dependent FMN reductase [Kaistia dalseonensis]